MQTRHVPQIDPRYWFGIIFASIFGTNLGDFYAHESGLGLGFGLLVLLILAAATFWIETKDSTAHEFHYWLAIIIIRTGATNIADYLAFRLRIPAVLLVPGLALILAVLAWRRSPLNPQGPATGRTDFRYWAAMLSAGVFGTAAGDICAHFLGQATASLASALMLAILLVTAKSRVASVVSIYWCTIALARTAGTCIGDWLAENKALHIGLPLSTLLTGTAFVIILTLWRTPRHATA